ncbi:SMI1/KNR4 family protein [Streptomyces sp. NPDC028635]|uniref:SMI1/KNR4 family protein n=1 Tax=Streptomyces sp. NPDC028635 TaxID=3154800 RepID=UPI0033D15DA0
MIPQEDRQFPAELAAAMAVRLDCIGEDSVDFEPYEAFLSADATTDWFRAWTGNGDLDGDAFRVFGQDGTGGCAAFWLVRPGRELREQPVVFLGSEGETGVIARDLASFLWLLADGFGPWEAATADEPESDWAPRTNEALVGIAQHHAPGCQASAQAVIAQAAQEFPDFDAVIMGLCR